MTKRLDELRHEAAAAIELAGVALVAHLLADLPALGKSGATAAWFKVLSRVDFALEIQIAPTPEVMRAAGAVHVLRMEFCEEVDRLCRIGIDPIAAAGNAMRANWGKPDPEPVHVEPKPYVTHDVRASPPVGPPAPGEPGTFFDVYVPPDPAESRIKHPECTIADCDSCHRIGQ